MLTVQCLIQFNNSVNAASCDSIIKKLYRCNNVIIQLNFFIRWCQCHQVNNNNNIKCFFRAQLSKSKGGPVARTRNSIRWQKPWKKPGSVRVLRACPVNEVLTEDVCQGLVWSSPHPIFLHINILFHTEIRPITSVKWVCKAFRLFLIKDSNLMITDPTI